MKVLELSKDGCKKFYNGNYKEMIKEEDGVIWDTNKNTTEEKLKRYMKNNKEFCRFYDLESKKYI